MLDSTKIQRRQSEIRQALADLVGKETPTEDETRQMGALDAEYRANETRYRAALIAEDSERREAGAELETREGREWSDLLGKFELRQAALHLDEGKALTGATLEVVNELRASGGFRGVPVPWEALEVRAGETIASGTPDPRTTRPTIDRIFAASVADRMGGQFINVGTGETEIPVTTSSISASWATTETGDVGGPTAYATVDRPLTPDHTLGVQVKLTRKAMKQSGAALEAAIRRDLAGAMRVEMDKAVFLGSGSSGQPTGLLNVGGSPTVFDTTPINDTPAYADFLLEVTEFMAANAITSPGEVRLMIRPETFNVLEATVNASIQMTEYHRLAWLLAGRQMTGTFPSNITVTSNALAAPSGSPLGCDALMTTRTGGISPFYVATWGAIDMVRDVYTDAKSGQVRLTALATMDVTYSRPEQVRILTGLYTA